MSYPWITGTGVTSMIQALHPILGSADDDTQVTCLYGSTHCTNVIGGDELDVWAAQSGGRFKLVHGN